MCDKICENVHGLINTILKDSQFVLSRVCFKLLVRNSPQI